MLIGHFYHHTRVFCEELLHHVVAFDVVQVDVQAALGIGEGHL